MSCPICSENTQPAFRPFCSKRCADIDLGRWMTGAYAVPAAEAPDGDEFDGFEVEKSFDKQN
ncbi:DNA gyrase inhibitor YacG [Epibacterium sp. SM1969]|uniref:DNA gyrase inhibitor YacG n=1 Tax=Tritonibacter aquimaris TaxID=2663379 RepID=A0A844AVY9_9RHOB|nr:DNA gyrase inhibitor YacG [Tritonibacter aquimaris]MQY44047.1 DNA gyrase inhibitor YacG [Tritonibacter aquimaris]